MKDTIFQLTNEQRKYLGLIPVEDNWEFVKFNDEFYLYFDGDIIRKKISISENSYMEQELCETTTDNRTILLPKTAKGKPKKLNYTATQSLSPFGVYFSFSPEYLCIANYTTQTTYYSKSFDKVDSLDFLKKWLDDWISETTGSDLEEIEAFKIAKRKHCKFKEGDFFTFKIDRRRWGFGRILLDVDKYKKTEEFKKQRNSGLKNLMGRPLIVKVYHKISDSSNVDLDELSQCMALPPQAVMDNQYYYGENEIIGHKELLISDYDEPLISFSESISSESDYIYLQYGLIYKESNKKKFNKYLDDDFRNEGIGFGLEIYNLEQCINQKSNDPFWNSGFYFVKKDLRNPINIDIKREIFKFFGLDADKSYADNLKLSEASKVGENIFTKLFRS